MAQDGWSGPQAAMTIVQVGTVDEDPPLLSWDDTLRGERDYALEFYSWV